MCNVSGSRACHAAPWPLAEPACAVMGRHSILPHLCAVLLRTRLQFISLACETGEGRYLQQAGALVDGAPLRLDQMPGA